MVITFSSVNSMFAGSIIDRRKEKQSFDGKKLGGEKIIQQKKKKSVFICDESELKNEH